MEKGKGEDNARPPECRRAALLAWTGSSGGWSVIGGIHVRIAIDYCDCLIPGEGERRRHARHRRRREGVCEHSCVSSAQEQGQRPLQRRAWK